MERYAPSPPTGDDRAAPDPFAVEEGDGPLVAVALHDGHAVRPEVARWLALPEEVRRREEDPFTAGWTAVGENRIVARRSRFEVDLNRPRDGAVYLTPEQSWGLEVWRRRPPREMVEQSLAIWDGFQRRVGELFARLAARHGRFVVFDLHSYNHRRGGPAAPPDDPQGNPEVNLGTGSLDRERWAPVVERLLAELRAYPFLGRRLDVRENVRFRGGDFAARAHRDFPDNACVLAIEWKKMFMDEWTGEPYPRVIAEIGGALAAAAAGVREVLTADDGGRRELASGRAVRTSR